MNRDRTKMLLGYLLTFLIIITLNFFIPRLMPGDPFTSLSSEEGDITVIYSEEQIERYKRYYGMDRPIAEQYIGYLKNLLKGNLGYSIYYNQEVVSILKNRVPWTVAIVICSLIISSFLGTILGSISAWFRNSKLDKILYISMVFISEVPAFLMGILLLFFMAGRWGLFPLSGGMSMFTQYSTKCEVILDILHHAILPVMTLSIAKLGEFYLISRSSMLSVMSKDYMKTARGKGLKSRRILFRHGLKNSILPVITRIFLSLGSIFGQAVLIENIFNYPGIGTLMRQGVMVRDYVLIQGIFLFVAITVLTMNFIADLIYKKLDSRVR